MLPKFAQEAARVLKSDGFLAMMWASAYLPVATAELSKHLYYRCQIVDDYGDEGAANSGVGISHHYKPILIFGKKTTKLPTFGKDILRRPVGHLGKEKLWFEWQQPLYVFEELVKRISKFSSTILDPFAGPGTTLVAAVKHGRKSIGIEIEQERIGWIKYRLISE